MVKMSVATLPTLFVVPEPGSISVRSLRLSNRGRCFAGAEETTYEIADYAENCGASGDEEALKNR